MLKTNRFLLIALLGILMGMFSSCSVYNDISVDKVDGVKLRGIQKNVVLFNVDLVVDNPNTKKIKVTNIEFKAWLNDRELGDFSITEPIRLIPCSRKTYSVQVEIKLVNVADVFKLANPSGLETLADRIEVEGVIKGRACPIRKTIKVKKQPLRDVLNML